MEKILKNCILRYYLSHSFTKLRKSGCGFSTVLEYSGWNWVPMYQRRVGISTISTSPLSGLFSMTSTWSSFVFQTD